MVDHLVPHSRGGTDEAGNLVTSCQSCNYGKRDWIIEELGLSDPRMRAPRLDSWDGLRRLLVRTDRVAAQQDLQDHWFAELDRGAGLSARLLACLEGLRDLGVTWSVNKVLIVNLTVGHHKLAIFGIERNGDIEVPWYIAEHKAAFRNFAVTLAGAISGAVFYETQKMWRVKTSRGRVWVAELLDASPALRTAFADLRRALPGPSNKA
ncbi:HNH endonuclease [Lichenicoccus sp.]|uniref:HNH endonuclease n=1 Tax=Lichenicoccus sp. TaxID=2781899 RepID=UPI003D0B785B